MLVGWGVSRIRLPPIRSSQHAKASDCRGADELVVAGFEGAGVGAVDPGQEVRDRQTKRGILKEGKLPAGFEREGRVAGDIAGVNTGADREPVDVTEEERGIDR